MHHIYQDQTVLYKLNKLDLDFSSAFFLIKQMQISNVLTLINVIH